MFNEDYKEHLKYLDIFNKAEMLGSGYVDMEKLYERMLNWARDDVRKYAWLEDMGALWKWWCYS